MNGNVRFIRKNGRVIPVRSSNKGVYVKQAVIGAGISSLGTVGRVALDLGHRVGNANAVKFGRTATKLGLALGIAAEVGTIVSASNANGGFGTKLGEYLKQTAVRWGGGIAGTVATTAFINRRIIKGMSRRGLKV